MSVNTNLNNKEMIDVAKKRMFQIVSVSQGTECPEAAKALALLIMAENETKLPNGVIREVLD